MTAVSSTRFRELAGPSPAEPRCAGRRLEHDGTGGAGVAGIVGSAGVRESCARAAGGGP